MTILDPTGNWVTVSSSWDNAYEIVEFTPAVTGNYTVRVNRFRCDTDPRWLGWAWYQQGADSISVTYQVHAKNLGWMNWVNDAQVAGTTGQSRRLEAMRVQLVNAPVGAQICYKVHMKGNGWGGVACDGAMAGTTGQSRRIEAAQIWLNNPPAGYDVCYQVHMKGKGWSPTACNGATAGTTGEHRRIEAIRVWLVP